MSIQLIQYFILHIRCLTFEVVYYNYFLCYYCKQVFLYLPLFTFISLTKRKNLDFFLQVLLRFIYNRAILEVVKFSFQIFLGLFCFEFCLISIYFCYNLDSNTNLRYLKVNSFIMFSSQQQVWLFSSKQLDYFHYFFVNFNYFFTCFNYIFVCYLCSQYWRVFIDSFQFYSFFSLKVVSFISLKILYFLSCCFKYQNQLIEQEMFCQLFANFLRIRFFYLKLVVFYIMSYLNFIFEGPLVALEFSSIYFLDFELL